MVLLHVVASLGASHPLLPLCVAHPRPTRHLEGLPTRVSRRRRREVFLIKLLQLNLFHVRLEGCNMICLLVSYPWRICHLATELKSKLKGLWTNSRLGVGLHEHVPRNLPLQIFFLQLQLCNIRLVMVHHLLVKLTRSLHHLSLLRNPYPHQFHLQFPLVLVELNASLGHIQDIAWLHSCHHQLLLHVSGRQVDPRNLGRLMESSDAQISLTGEADTLQDRLLATRPAKEVAAIGGPACARPRWW